MNKNNSSRLTKEELDERLRILFMRTAMEIELAEIMEEIVPPDNPYWSNHANDDDDDDDDDDEEEIIQVIVPPEYPYKK